MTEGGGGGGQTAKDPSGWSVDMLKEHLNSVIALNDKRYEERFIGQVQAVTAALAAQEKAVNAALVAAEKAVLVAETNAQEWRKGANEWRGTLNDVLAKFAMRTDLDSIKERLDRTEGGKAGVISGRDWIVVVVGLVLTAIAIVGAMKNFT